MSDTKTLPGVMPSAAPSEADIAAWNELPRDEQLRRMREALAHADCNTVSTLTMADIRKLAHERIAERNRG